MPHSCSSCRRQPMIAVTDGMLRLQMFAVGPLARAGRFCKRMRMT
jgi:hypothetical protein